MLVLPKSLFKKIFNKASQIQSDPILRSWLIGRWKGEPAYTAHHPSYLSDLLPLFPENPTRQFSCLKTDAPKAELQLKLPCISIVLRPGDVKKLLTRHFGDIETKLALHRFAWLSEFGEDVPTDWVAAIWRAWVKKYSAVDDSWAWPPYTFLSAPRIFSLAVSWTNLLYAPRMLKEKTGCKSSRLISILLFNLPLSTLANSSGVSTATS